MKQWANVTWGSIIDIPSNFDPIAHSSRHITGGSDPIPPAVSGGDSGLLTGLDKAKLDTIQSGATANSSDSALRDRSTHTGTQPISSIDGLPEALAEIGPSSNVFNLHDFKFSGNTLTVSPTVPWLRADKNHFSLSASNFIDFVPYLLSSDYSPDDGVTTVFTASITSASSNPILVLNNDAVHIQLVRDLLNDLRFDAWSESLNDIQALDTTRFNDWGMVLEILTSTVPGITAGSKRVVTYGSSLAQSLDPASRQIRIDGTATGTGSLTFKVKPFVRQSDNNARWRKIDDAVLQSGFSGLRRLDQGQGHRHSFSSGAAMVAWGGGYRPRWNYILVSSLVVISNWDRRFCL
ncbi:hypothetical protein [Leptospira levettii]|uniref:hypothetical protein n=1 Tax=Leptospira levettii TaxID=2023178 RepID=UPI000C2AD27B|nr:hypothetical protein [Leptospira levettii]PJZ87609.1 hypothetical protein CH368_15990 [Leptospira levettii]